MSFLDRASVFAVAAALLFAAHLLHRSRHTKAKHAGVILSFVAGLAFLVTFIGKWVSGADWLGGFAVAGLIVCVAIIVIDWLWDKKPDKPAFWAAFVLALFIVLGATQIPQVGSQIGEGGKQVGAEIKKIGDDKAGEK